MKKYIVTLSFLLIGGMLHQLKAQAPTADYLVKVHEVTTAQMNGITGAQKGMLCYNTDSSGVFYFDGTNWKNTGGSGLIDTIKMDGDTLVIEENGVEHKVDIYKRSPQTLTSGATAWDYDLGYNAQVTLTGNSTITLSNVPAGAYGTLVVKQDGTGGRSITLPANSKVVCSGGGVIELTQSANAEDVLSFYYDGTNYYWTYGKNFN